MNAHSTHLDYLPDTRILDLNGYPAAMAVTPVSEVYLRELTDKERVMDLHPGDTRRPRFEIRCGVALMGRHNTENPQHNPFHPDYRDNYSSGTGNTEEEAVASLLDDIRGISDSLFYDWS